MEVEKNKDSAISSIAERLKGYQELHDFEMQLRKEMSEEEKKALYELWDIRASLLEQSVDEQKRKEVDAYKQILKAKIKVEDAQEAIKAAEKRKGDKKEWEEYKKNLTKKQKQALKIYDDTLKKQAKADKEQAEKEFAHKYGVDHKASSFSDLKDQISGIKDAFGEGGFAAGMKAMSDLAKQFNDSIDDIAAKKGAIDTRLQGSKNKKGGLTGFGDFGGVFGSYWDAMSTDIRNVAGISPLIKQESVVTNLEKLVGQGISFDVEQRAFLETIKDKIATTFEAADGTLLRLVRIQQQDTTAARLGMESALTSFLNNMYETTEYMQSVAKSVRTSLQEAEALMGSKSAAAFEYQVQKWMGSLYSVGMGDSTVSALAGAIGQIAAGDISGINGQGPGNLVIMAANNAGISIADALADGLDESSTNRLMEAMVDYLGDIYDETKDSRVVQQQYAKVFGLNASDLKAAANLRGSVGNISGNNLNYNGMLAQLNNMAGSMYARTSLGELSSNAFANAMYSIAGSVANSPALYGMYKGASLLDLVAGGIAIPAFSVYGNMVDLETTVADLMRGGALGGGILSAIGGMAAAGNGGGVSGRGMLAAMGIGSGINTVSRGSGSGLLTTALSTSESGTIASNSSSEDIKDKTMNDANEDANKTLAEKQDESSETKLSTVDEHVVEIAEILRSVLSSSGAQSLSVKMTQETIDDLSRAMTLGI